MQINLLPTARRWLTRIGGFTLTLAAAFPLMFTEVDPANAASPVCFTVYGKCFCIDYFTTEPQDMVWGQIQEEIANTYNDFTTQQLDTQIQDVVSIIRDPSELLDWRDYGEQTKDLLLGREAYDLGVTPQAVATSQSQLDDNPHIGAYLASHPTHTASNTIRPKVEAIAYGLAAPESLLPYQSGQLNDDKQHLTNEELVLNKAWADRFITPPDTENTPTPEELVDTSTLALNRYHLEARTRAIGTIAQSALLAPATQDTELAGLDVRIEQLRQIQQLNNASVADIQTGLILAETMESEILIRRLESHLRQERVMGAMLALKQEPSVNNAKQGVAP